MSIITRFPPSPTGHAHIGSYRTAIFNYLYARKHEGTFLLRIEDTDKERSKKEYQEGIIESLEWLGLEYDGFAVQTEHVAEHTKAMQKLIDEGKAYISKEEAKDGSGVIKEIVRFKNPNKSVTFTDLILGDITSDSTELGDFVIGRNINDPLYHMAVVFDDMIAGTTHVIRGADHISNTARQILLIEALGGKAPQYAHIPLVLGEDKQKLSKRKGALSVLEYKNRGYLPQAILNAAAFIGFNPGGEKEIYSKEELIEVFDLDKVQHAGAVFNPVKLDWFNGEHMKLLSEEEYITKARAFVPTSVPADVVDKILLASRDRIKYFGELKNLEEDAYFWKMDEVPDGELLLVPEKMRKDVLVTRESTKQVLCEIVSILESATDEDFASSEKTKELVWKYAEEKGRAVVLWPLRMALTGREKSMDPFTMLWILGKQVSLERIQKAIVVLE